MAIFDVTYSTLWDNILPPRKRTTIMQAWGAAIMSAVQWAHDTFITDFRDGTNFAKWDGILGYLIGDKVTWGGATYYCIKDAPISSPYLFPINTTYWIPMNNSFIGILEQATYTSQRILFEYALARYFGYTFVQPVAGMVTRNDIYIDYNETDNNSFLVGSVSESSATASNSGNYSDFFVGSTYTNAETHNFTIYYKTSMLVVFPNAVTEIEAIANRLKLAGTTYILTAY